MFTKDVFRKKQRWASWLVVAIAVCLVLGSAGSAWVGDWEQVDPLANPGYWPQTVGGLAPAVWMGVEGLASLPGPLASPGRSGYLRTSEVLSPGWLKLFPGESDSSGDLTPI